MSIDITPRIKEIATHTRPELAQREIQFDKFRRGGKFRSDGVASFSLWHGLVTREPLEIVDDSAEENDSFDVEAHRSYRGCWGMEEVFVLERSSRYLM